MAFLIYEENKMSGTTSGAQECTSAGNSTAAFAGKPMLTARGQTLHRQTRL